jgi:predicted metal-dependent peptidase
VPWEPGTSQSSLVPRVALVIDVSDSIDEQLLKQFTHEIEAIVRRQAAGLILIIGDDRVRKTVVFESGRVALDNLEFAGGGGTDFSPLLAEAIRHHPDIGIILTDLDGPAGSSPPFPVVWAVPAVRAQAVPPFGRILVLE